MARHGRREGVAAEGAADGARGRVGGGAAGVLGEGAGEQCVRSDAPGGDGEEVCVGEALVGGWGFAGVGCLGGRGEVRGFFGGRDGGDGFGFAGV
jgi:hypothetical protein